MTTASVASVAKHPLCRSLVVRKWMPGPDFISLGVWPVLLVGFGGPEPVTECAARP